MLQTRAAINAIATQFSKLKPEVVGDNKQVQAVLNKPNRLNTTSQFLYRTATILVAESTAFLMPVLKSPSKIGEIVVSIPQTVDAVESGGTLYYQFTFNGKSYLIEASRIGVLTQFQYKNDLYGTGNGVLAPTLEVMNKQGEGLVERITNSAVIQWIGRLNSQTSPDDIKKKRETFADTNLTSKNASGLLLYDNSFADLKQVEYKNFTIDPEEQELINNNVYSYYGVNEKILRNEFDEEGWNAFFEGRIEPLSIQVSEVLSEILGDEVILTANRMQYASSETKAAITQMFVDRGMMSLDTALTDIWNMKPLDEGGDIRIIRGEYINVDKLPEHTLTKAKTYLEDSGEGLGDSDANKK